AEHVAAGVPTVPVAVNRDDVPADLVERERRIFSEQAAASGKPQNIIDKMVGGRIDKYYKEVTVLDQPWVRDDSKTIRDLVKGLGGDASIRRFARFQMGQE
ncbi:MAG: elongation factor Ts, partial [bacterium]